MPDRFAYSCPSPDFMAPDYTLVSLIRYGNSSSSSDYDDEDFEITFCVNTSNGRCLC